MNHFWTREILQICTDVKFANQPNVDNQQTISHIADVCPLIKCVRQIAITSQCWR